MKRRNWIRRSRGSRPSHQSSPEMTAPNRDDQAERGQSSYGAALGLARNSTLLVGIPGLAWEECLRVHHALGSNFHSLEMRAEVYCRFHRFLRLGRNFGIAQCTEAWIKISDRDPALLESYIPSPRHLVLKSKGGEYAVFNKTAFVQSRLDAMAEEDRLKAESEEAQRAAALAEQLRRSRFTTFVYLMEDPRNGAFKIGRSQTPGIRERTLQSEVPETLLRFSIPAEETHERELHALFQHRRVRGEWFDLTTNDVFAVIAFLKEHGDPERASGDFHWLGRLFATSRPNRSSAQPDPGSSAYS